MATKKKAARKKPAPTGADFRQLIDGLTNAFQPRVTLMSYREMRDMCGGFIESINLLTHQESTDLEKEMVTVAGKEILETLREKYSMHPANASAMLLTMGMGMLKELDNQYDKRRERE
jgi:hypothetical protein